MLTQTIGNLELSDKCKWYLDSLSIGSLQEFINHGWDYYRREHKVDTLLFNEVICLLLKNDLLHLMEGK